MIGAYLIVLGAIAITYIIFSVLHWILKEEFEPMSILFNGRLLMAFGVVWIALSFLLGKFFGVS